MVWNGNTPLFLAAVLIQATLIPITLVYYSKVIAPNKDKLLWKIRRPNYFLFYIIITLLNDIIRSTFGLLLDAQVINQYWYSLTSVPLAYFGGITWGSIRLWLLYYDIKLTRKGELFLLSTHLGSASTSSISYIPGGDKRSSRDTQQKSYTPVICRVFTAVIIFCAITLLLEIVGLVSISKLVLYGFILFLLCFYTYFLFRLRCCRCCACKKPRNALKSSPFRDDWCLLLELSIIWFMWMIGLFGAFFLLPFRGQPIYPVLIAYLTMITRVIITLTMLILPYNVSQRCSARSSRKISTSVLKKVLSTKSYFYAFVQHLVHEMAIENLSALVEIWQFKYEHKYHLQPLKISKKINIEIEKSKEENSPRSTTEDCSWLNMETATIAYESSYNLSSSTPSPACIKDVQIMVEFLESLRWNKLPLAQSIALHLSEIKDANNTMDINQKMKQCDSMMKKYFDERSYDSLNVSYSVRHQIYNQYNNLSLYVSDASPRSDEVAVSEFVSQPQIQSDDEFKEKILKVFDVSIDDLVNNLQDSLTRFVLTDEFKVAQ